MVWENAGEIWSARMESSRRSALATFPVSEGRQPTLALAEHSRGMLVWMIGPPGREHLLASTVEAGGAVDASQHRLDASGPIQHLQVAMDRRGGAIVLWSQSGPRGWEIRVQTYDGRTKSWEEASTQLGQSDPTPTRPHLIMNRQGVAMAIWQAREEDCEGLVVAYNWPHERIWSDHLVRIAASNAAELTASLDSRGNALVCWIQRFPGEPAVLETSRFSEASCEWSPPYTLATAPGLFQLRMSTDSNGESMLAWRQKENAGSEHLFGRLCRKGDWGDILRINSGPEYLGDYALLKTVDQAAVLLLPVRGGAVIHRMEGAFWLPPIPIAQDSTEVTLHPTLLKHPAGLTALWLSGSQNDVRLMVSNVS